MGVCLASLLHSAQRIRDLSARLDRREIAQACDFVERHFPTFERCLPSRFRARGSQP